MRGLFAAVLVGCGIGCGTAWGGEPGMPAPSGLADAIERYAFSYPTADGSELRMDRSIASPSVFLGYELGTRFTRHHDMVRYAEYLASVSDRVQVEQYGWSTQGRKLIVVTVSSVENIDALDEILSRNLELTEPGETDASRAREISRMNPAIQWLSFGVHGNEASVGEAALQTMYTLAAGEEEVAEWLEDCIVVIDPDLNPDGRMRYISHYENAVGMKVDELPISREHEEPWPSGRSNHYMFDLNRDWVWGTQIESRARVAAYRKVMPHGHIDAHEQGYHSPFFMGAGDEPYSANIPQETKDWIEIYGTASADVFDRLGLPYAMRERFDYLYPGYGKVLPTYHGAVSLLTEQAGHGRGGLAIRVTEHGGPDGDGYVLTLRERTRNHWLVSLAYVQLAAKTHESNQLRFYEYFRSADAGEAVTSIEDGSDESAKVKAYVLSLDSVFSADSLDQVARLLDMHGVEYSRLSDPVTLEENVSSADIEWVSPLSQAEDLRTWREEEEAMPIILPAGSMVIETAQPLGRLVRTLFERDPVLSEIETYDITAWGVAAMHGLRGYAWSGPMLGLSTGAWRGSEQAEPVDPDALDGAVALLVDANSMWFPSVLDAATQEGILARIVGMNEGSIMLPGEDGTMRSDDAQEFGVGSLLVHVVRNEPTALARFVERVNELGVRAGVVSAGAPLMRSVGGELVGRGPALGNNGNRRFVLPKIAVAGGRGVSSLSFGHTWHMLDAVWGVEHHRVNTNRLDDVLDDVNVVVLPSRRGAWEHVDALREFVEEGGTVISLGSSSLWATRELIGLEGEENTAFELNEMSENEREQVAGRSDFPFLSAADRIERADEYRVPGAMLEAELDITHRLSVGVPAQLAFHIFNNTPMPVSDDGEIVSSFAGYKRTKLGGHGRVGLHRNAPAMTVHRVGGGRVICFASDPTNRGMNIAGMRLLMNAIMLGPSEPGSLQPLRGR